MSQNASDKLAHQRLSVLELAEALGNVSRACRQRGMTRTQFYDYKRRFELQGLEGLKICHRSTRAIRRPPSRRSSSRSWR